MEICFKVIPNEEQRYETTGDWWVDENGILQIRCSDYIVDEKRQFLIFIHEVVEGYLCEKKRYCRRGCSKL